MVFTPVPRRTILDALLHIRDLYRRILPSTEQETLAYERREIFTRDLLSNLHRTNEHPTLKTLLDVGEICSLTLDGVHRLFGYNLDAIREFDLKLNGGRTHIERRHERLSTSEIHRAACLSGTHLGATGEGKRDNGGTHHADHANQLDC